MGGQSVWGRRNANNLGSLDISVDKCLVVLIFSTGLCTNMIASFLGIQNEKSLGAERAEAFLKKERYETVPDPEKFREVQE